MSINIECLWKDRKRHLGLPLSFTRYQLSEDRLFVSVGFLNIKDPLMVKELIHNQVEEMKIQRRVRFGEIATTDMGGDDDLDDLDN